MSVSKHMMKGLLDGALLGLIAQGETYGYEILDNLKAHQFPKINFGSIYPVLLRLDKKGYVSTVSKKSDNGGPRRKYYSITESGKQELAQFKQQWKLLTQGMNNLMEGVDEIE